ncbi:microtubule-associated protein 70-5-like isoform X3 [Tasmannia lanceolata]|uniref:microtubule-associated protein 70-5-like isoform X3 n=1 Tax=Tasmannia lanceolata TaxID=3420 RepID=UPI0040641AA3
MGCFPQDPCLIFLQKPSFLLLVWFVHLARGVLDTKKWWVLRNMLRGNSIFLPQTQLWLNSTICRISSKLDYAGKEQICDECQFSDKDRELGIAHSEIKALRTTEHLKEKAVEEVCNELNKVDAKLRVSENLLEHKNLEIKKLINEKKEALAAQFAAEAALRRVHATKKYEEFVPVEAIIAPLESDIKLYRNEIAMLHEDKKALERLNKSKEVALVEAEKILKSALERAMIVEEVQNQNFELKRKIEICQEENRILDKTNRQKVVEVEKLSQTIHDLEESILASGGASNAIRNYQRLVFELNEEKRALERELARVKISANRVAVVVANEWKEDNEKVMPVKQWLEERRFLQDKLRLRLKTLEEGLKHVSSFSVNTNTSLRSQQTEMSEHVLGFLPNNAGQRKRSTSQPRASLSTNKSSVLKQPSVALKPPNATGHLKRVNSLKMKCVAGENMVRKNLWAPRSKFFDDIGKENAESKVNSDVNATGFIHGEVAFSEESKIKGMNDTGSQNKGSLDFENEDSVSGTLYDRLQKEVINLRKSSEDKDKTLNAKDEEIKMLVRKVDALTKAMEIEARRMKREVAAKEKEVILAKVEDNKQKSRTMNVSKRAAKHLEASVNSRS